MNGKFLIQWLYQVGQGCQESGTWRQGLHEAGTWITMGAIGSVDRDPELCGSEDTFLN